MDKTSEDDNVFAGIKSKVATTREWWRGGRNSLNSSLDISSRDGVYN